VIPEIDIYFVAFRLNAVDGGGQKNVPFVAKKRPDGGLPRTSEFVQKFDCGFRRCGGNFDLALIVGSDRYCRLVFVLRDGDDFVEVDCE
jgi:hypothetical protein